MRINDWFTIVTVFLVVDISINVLNMYYEILERSFVRPACLERRACCRVLPASEATRQHVRDDVAIIARGNGCCSVVVEPTPIDADAPVSEL
jgi:hypothetical protein